MLKKLLTKSGRRLMRAIKKLSTRSQKSKKLTQMSPWPTTVLAELDAISLSWSMPSLDAKSIDTYMTDVAENLEQCSSRCCTCYENEENQRNENRENEMTI